MTHCFRRPGNPGMSPLRFTVTLAAAAMLAPSLCLAQGVRDTLPGSPLGPVGIDHSGGKPATGLPERPPPAALPGAQSSGAIAPATKRPTDMAPNDALFDAINRGDIATARDALSRGAQLDAHNILGMTPLELSVDLGRNDISFLLLSMRGEPGSLPATAQAATGTQASNAKVPAAAERTKARAPAAPRVARAAVPVQPAPRVYANDGGTPIPAAGFLGFGGGRGTP
ncbi:MAG TPA: hypothetical protein VIG49_07820 [Acetobacteraceae bacterium]